MKKRNIFIICIFSILIIYTVFNIGEKYNTFFKSKNVDIENNIQSSNNTDNSLFRPISSKLVYNNELQEYLSSQCKLDENKVLLTANKKDKKYISGKIESKYAFRYGIFSFRINNTLNKKGFFPAIWFRPDNGCLYPELDIYEMIGSHPNEMHGVLHYQTKDTLSKLNFIHKLNNNQIKKSYVLKFEWTDENLTWYIDNKKVHQMPNKELHEPMYMIMNLAVGGDWPGNPDDNAFPAIFDVEILDFSPEETYPRQTYN